MRFRFSTLEVLPGATLTGGADNIASEERFRSKGSVGHSYGPISEKEVPLKTRNSLIAMPFFYSSGEEIRKGDRVLLHGEPGEIEFVADPAESPDDWFVKNQGGGIMVLELKVFGRLFIPEPQTDEHLTFVSRQTRR